MKILFEDKKTDQISRFYQAAFYTDFIENNFFYAGGVGNLENMLLTKVLPVCEKDEHIYIFMDLPPGNLDVRKVYIQLSSLIKRCGYPVLIIPMVSAERNLIKALVQLQVLDLTPNVEICTEVGFYANSDLYESEEERKRFRNFERYCKLVLLKAVPDCMKHTKGTEESPNLQYDVFYTHNCICSSKPKDSCKEINLEVKLQSFLAQYPFTLSDGLKYEFKTTVVNPEDIHCKLVDEYNQFTRRLKVLDVKDAFKYKEIKYML